MQELILKVMSRRKIHKSKNRIIKLILVRFHIYQKLEGCVMHV